MHRKNLKLIYIFLIISTLSGVESIFLFLSKKYYLSFSLIFIYYILIFFVQYNVDKRFKYIFITNFLSLIFFPYFPIIYIVQNKKIDPLYKPIKISENKLVEIRTVKYSSTDLAPFKTILKYGDFNQRKYVIRFIYNSIKDEKIDFVEGIDLIRSAINMDNEQHPDVLLYASDALTNIENFLINRISLYEENLNSLPNYINYAKYTYYYTKAEFVLGEHKYEILKRCSMILKSAIETYPNSSKLTIYTLNILYMLNDFESLEKLLNEKLKKIKTQEIYEYAIFYYIKRRSNTMIIKKLISEFIELGFEPKNEALRYLMGG